MRSFFSCFLFLWYSIVATKAQDSTTTALTLEKCIEIALQNNAEVQKVKNQAVLNSLNLKQAKALVLPRLSASFGHELSFGRSLDPVTNTFVPNNLTYGSQGISTSVILFNGLNILKTIREQSFAFKASEMDEQRAKDELTLDVLLSYVQVITSRDILDQANQQLLVTQEQLNRAEILNQDGAISPGEYYDLKGRFQGDKQLLIDAENSLTNNKIALTKLLNIPYSNTYTFKSIDNNIDISTDTLSATTLFAHATDHFGIIKASQLWKESAEYGLKAARALYSPSLSAGGSIYSNYSNGGSDNYFQQFQDNIGRSFGLSLAIPILTGFQTRLNVSRAKVALLNAEIDLENNKNNLQQETEMVLFNLKNAKAKYKSLQEQVTSYQESFRVAEVRFEAGDINTVEYLIQKNKHDQSKISLVIAFYEWQLRHRMVAYYNGSR